MHMYATNLEGTKSPVHMSREASEYKTLNLGLLSWDHICMVIQGHCGDGIKLREVIFSLLI